MAVDVAVIGAGPAGAVASRVLALSGSSVVLIDPLSSLSKVGESLPGAARPLLRDMGLLSSLERSSPHPCMGNRVAWGGERLIVHDAIHDPHGPGWHLDRRRFDQELRDAARSAGVQGLQERLERVSRIAGGWLLRLSGTKVHARWLIDASGRASILARRLGVGRIRDQELVAVYAWADHQGMDRCTLIESVDNGWWYSALLPDGRRIAALHVCAGEAALIRSCPAQWLDRLGRTRHLGVLCDGARWGLPRACDASGGQLQAWSGEGWLAVGDAALAFDPLSSQGMFNALYTGMRGAQAVSDALKGRPDAVESYSATLVRVRQAYLRQIRHYYGSESRWSSEVFWQERRA